MTLSLESVWEHLRHGDPGTAWKNLAPSLQCLPAEQRAEAADQIAGYIHLHLGDVDPIVQEQFCGRMALGCGQEEKGREALARAQRWSALRERAKQDNLDLEDLPALYRYLGAHDFREYAEGKERSDRAKLLLDENSVAYLVMAQQMEKLLPVLEHFSGASWLTVGDGRHAFEARFLMKHGAGQVLPSNYDPTLLKEAQRLGYIEKYAEENLEKLSFADDSFDFVCCKDTLHHLLRPYLGLYEMLRVAREGIFLIEPFDHSFAASALYQTRPDAPYHDFEEEAGNYVYSFSERELEKLCVSHGWRCLAARGVNIIQGNGIDNTSTDPRDLRLQRARVERSEHLAAKGKGAWVNQASLLLRHLPSDPLRAALRAAGYQVLDLPCNPHTRRAIFLNLEKLYPEVD